MPAAGVFSFPRSGTHFLINTLKANFGYQDVFDIEYGPNVQGINFFHPPHMQNLLQQLVGLETYVAKSHLQAPFFDEAAGQMGTSFTFFYIYRHPAAALNSYRKFIHTWAWEMGPKRDSLTEFMTAPPQGQMMLLLYRVAPTVLDFWADHVRGWLELAAARDNVHAVKYEDLRDDFQDRTRDLAEILGKPMGGITTPARDAYIVAGDQAYDDPETGDWHERGHDLAVRRLPELMRDLGYA